MDWLDAGTLVVVGGIAGELKNLGTQVLEDGAHVDRGTTADTFAESTLRQVASDTSDGELKSSLCQAGSALRVDRGEFDEGPGTLRDGVLDQVSWEDETDSSLDFATGEGGFLGVRAQLTSLTGDLAEDVVDEGVHDGHTFLGNDVGSEDEGSGLGQVLGILWLLYYCILAAAE